MKTITVIAIFFLSVSSFAGNVMGDLINTMGGIGSFGGFYALRESEFAKIRVDFDKQKAIEQQQIIEESKAAKQAHASEMVKAFDAKIRLDQSAIKVLKSSIDMFKKDLKEVNTYIKQRKIEALRMQSTQVGLKEFNTLALKGSLFTDTAEGKAYLQKKCQDHDFKSCYQLKLLQNGNTVAFALTQLQEYISDEGLLSLHDYILEAYLYSTDQLPRFLSDYCLESAQKNAYAAMAQTGVNTDSQINFQCLIE
jgi:hypothetical protein